MILIVMRKNEFVTDLISVFVRGFRCINSENVSYAARNQELNILALVHQKMILCKMERQWDVLLVHSLILAHSL